MSSENGTNLVKWFRLALQRFADSITRWNFGPLMSIHHMAQLQKCGWDTFYIDKEDSPKFYRLAEFPHQDVDRIIQVWVAPGCGPDDGR